MFVRLGRVGSFSLLWMIIHMVVVNVLYSLFSHNLYLLFTPQAEA